MSQPLQTINLIAPGFKGVNTEDSPIAQDTSFADVADNAVIDKRGRIAARRGVEPVTTDATELGQDYVHRIHYFYDDKDNTEVFTAGNNKIMSGTSVLTDVTPAGYTISDNNWKIINFNNEAYFFQRGHEPLVYSADSGLQRFSQLTGETTEDNHKCHEAIGAYGRLWITDSDTDTQTVYWSDLLTGTDFTGGSSGSIEVSKAWPDGFDEVVGIAAHNDLLIIFGEHSILVYGGASSPASMILKDTIAGVGCIDRSSIQHIGTDVLFLDTSGLKSLGRVVVEKSLPLSDLSINVKTELVSMIESRVGPVDSVYSPEFSFYLIAFPENGMVYCFDLKGKLENNSFRVTRWPGVPHRSFERRRDGTLYVGTPEGLGEYRGYLDNGNSYRFKYFSPALTFGDPSKLKMIKTIRPTLVGGEEALVCIKWAYDFSSDQKHVCYTIGDKTSYKYSVPDTEYMDALYSGTISTTRKKVNGSGSGTVVTIGVEANIMGHPLSLQEINVLALMGKTV